jgi:hypothetical protein
VDNVEAEWVLSSICNRRKFRLGDTVLADIGGVGTCGRHAISCHVMLWMRERLRLRLRLIRYIKQMEVGIERLLQDLTPKTHDI